MTHKSLYVFVITVLFSVVYLPEIPSIIFHKPILIHHIPRKTIKFFLLLAICFMESTLIKKQYPGIFGWVLSFVLLLGILDLIIHFPYAKEIILTSTILILANLIYHAVIEKNKNLYNYLLFGFILLRVFMILTPIYFRTWRVSPYYELTWWIDILLGVIISILGIKYCFRLYKTSKI